MNTLTHIHRPRRNKVLVKATKARCIRENIIVPVLFIAFFGYIAVQFVSTMGVLV